MIFAPSCTRKKASAKRTVRCKADSQLLQHRHDAIFYIADPHRVFRLKCGHWLDGVCAARLWNRILSEFTRRSVVRNPIALSLPA